VLPETRQRVESSIMGHEGLMLRVYDDATGKVVQPGGAVTGWLSIGYGRNLVGLGITKVEADYLLDNDLVRVEAELDRLLPAWRTFSEARQWAIFELAYNMGPARFVGGWPNTVADMLNGRWELAAGALAGSRWRRQVGESRAQPIIRAIARGDWL
jgi:lysozyme